MTDEKKSFEEVQREVDKKVEKLHELDEKFRRWEWDLSKVPVSHRKYAWRVWNWKKRMRELEYRSIEPDDYHDWNKHKNDRF